MIRIYHPNKLRKKTYEEPGLHNVSVNDFHLVDYVGQIVPFFIKKVNDINFSSEREGRGQGLKSVLCVPFRNAVILTRGGDLLVGRTHESDVQACVDFVSENPNLVKGVGLGV